MTKHRPLAISRADAARHRGVSRSAVTRAARAGGALHDATLPGGRIDAGHPAFRAWMRRASEPELLDPLRYPTFEDFSLRFGIAMDELERDRHLFAEAIVLERVR